MGGGSMTPYLTFCSQSRTWLKRLVRRWYRRLQYDWRVNVELVDTEELTGGGEFTVLGKTLALPVYRTATIWISEDAEEGDDAEWLVLHELLHLKYEIVMHVLNQCWDERRKIDKAKATQLMRDAIETMIEQDVKVMMRLAGK